MAVCRGTEREESYSFQLLGARLGCSAKGHVCTHCPGAVPLESLWAATGMRLILTVCRWDVPAEPVVGKTLWIQKTGLPLAQPRSKATFSVRKGSQHAVLFCIGCAGGVACWGL